MTNQLKQIIIDELIKLPKEIQESINSLDWVNIAQNICLKYLLGEREINKIQTEVFLVLINKEYLNDLSLNIKDQAEINKDRAENIAKEMEEKIFIPIEKAIQTSAKTGFGYRETSWVQTINFIISGGDYSVFLD